MGSWVEGCTGLGGPLNQVLAVQSTFKNMPWYLNVCGIRIRPICNYDGNRILLAIGRWIYAAWLFNPAGSHAQR